MLDATATTAERIEALRREMAKEEIAAYLVPGTDPHQSEYPPEHFHCRHWLSGFYGSAGTLVVTRDAAGLWTDSRYFLEAEERLEGTPITLFRMDTPGVPRYNDWLASVLKAGDTLSFDGRLVSLANYSALEEQLTPQGVAVTPGPDLLAPIWQDRPPLPDRSIYLHDTAYAGETAEDKISRVRGALAAAGADTAVVTALDEIAWLLNIRGSDVSYNPVAVAFLLLREDRLDLCVESAKVSREVAAEFRRLGVTLHDYRDITELVAELPKESRFLFDGDQLNTALAASLPPALPTVPGTSPIGGLKAIKNGTQIDGITAAMRRDGAALVDFFYWLEEQLSAGAALTEFEITGVLKETRARRERFVSEAFNTIAGAGPNGAIVHYAPPAHGSAPITGETFLLLDSGAQYLDGTTDITRTVSFGPPTEAQRRDYTLVLKGHIALGTTPFPRGTTGHSLDVLARQYLWRELANYGHGTGHGVGHFLNVHEGPQRISQKALGVPLEPGMLISNEPGLYRPGEYGIRIENLLLVVEAGEAGFDSFLRFETVSLFPLERNLIETALLTTDELAWVEEYHRRVYRELAPLLEEEKRAWLKEKTAPLTE